MVLLSCLNYFSCGIANKLNYETCVDHVHSLDSAMVACITPLASLSIVDIIVAMSVDYRRNWLRHNNVDVTEFFYLCSVFCPTSGPIWWNNCGAVPGQDQDPSNETIVATDKTTYSILLMTICNGQFINLTDDRGRLHHCMCIQHPTNLTSAKSASRFDNSCFNPE